MVEPTGAAQVFDHAASVSERGRHGRAAALAALVAPAPAGLKLEVAVVEVRVIACRPLPVAARASGPARGGVSG